MYMICWILLVDIYRPLSALILLQRDLRRPLSKWYNNVCDACYGYPARHVCLPTSCLKSTHDSCIYLRILAPYTISIPVDALSVNTKTTGVTTVAEPSGTPEITTQFLLGLVLRDVSVFCRSLFTPLSLLLYN